MNEFKAGDKVYYPTMSNRVLKVKERHGEDYPIYVNYKDSFDSFTKNGLLYMASINPSIFYATQENYEMLSKLYPTVEFEPPPKRKEPKEVIKAMLASGAIFIPCLVVDYDDNRILDYKKATRHSSSVLIYGISENGRFLSTNPHCSSYKYAVPFDIETGKVIIDFVNGEVVLED